MIGVSEEKFWDSIPIEMEPYRKMDELQEQRIDYHMWLMGAYVTNAVGVAVGNVLSGKNKAKAQYLDKPFSMIEKEQEEDTSADDFNKFAAWAVVYNENLKDKGKQGE